MTRRRTYYDHEPAYRCIVERGGTGWDDLVPGAQRGSYDAIDAFLASRWCPPPTPALRVLDVGCGGGQVAIRFARLGFTVAASDFSETAVALATRNAAQARVSVACAVADCVDLAPHRDAGFDVVIDHHVLHCLYGADRLAFLRAARRVLAPEGVLFSDTMCVGPRLDTKAYDIDPDTRRARSGTRYWATPDEIDAELASAGFEIVHREVREVDDEPNVGRMRTTVARRSSRPRDQR